MNRFRKFFSTAQQVSINRRLASLLLLMTTSTISYASSYAEHPEFKKFFDEVTAEGIYPGEKLRSLLQGTQRQESILKAIAKPAEKTLTWASYRKIFLTEDRINKGIEFYNKHKTSFQRASEKTGVPEEMILAILGVETRYGKHRGNYRVVDALATLGFDYPPRAKFFRKQLKEFLYLEKEAGIDLTKAQGSYAGAMGFPQFIPSSYRHYAIDFDGDNKIDLIDNPVDAIGSIANYFKVHGWRPNQPVTSPARYLKVDDTKDNALESALNKQLKPRQTVKQLTELGLVSDFPLGAEEKATAMRLQGENGDEYWIGLTNFYVITRYNHSRLYAMAAYQLSQALKEKMKEQR
ncbi:MAG: lytic murein transglycosylase B [Pseudomonadales bacterium]|nr:lytic murein transglycosylase B [Pseudomonadales bacterium]